MSASDPGALEPIVANDVKPPETIVVRKLFGIHPLKWVFALEYMLQGLANPFQNLTYQPFFRHLRFDYGLSEAATQGMFAKSYLAWSFKPLIGFLIDAYGRTRTILIVLLATGCVGYLLTPLIDTGPMAFFAFMFLLSVAFAGTDVAVDRATVIEGDAEAKATGRSKAATVGLNQAICWASIYGTAIVAAVLGGYVAEHVPFNRLMIGLALVPLVVLGGVLMLPRDRAEPIPIKRSVADFWRGLNTGPILGVILFYFIFQFQPLMGALWNNYLIETLKFTQTEIGIGDGATNAGYFLGVVLFVYKGVAWQDRIGLRKIFRIYIGVSIVINLTQYLLVDPWFSGIASGLHLFLPFWSESTVRLIYLSAYNLLYALGLSLIRMSTFSLVGAVIPVAAAGSLFAGFMSVANIAFSFSYSSGAWLYEHGLEFAPVRALQQALFDLPARPGGELSVNMLILVGSLAFVMSFVCVNVLPDRRATLATEGNAELYPGPERWLALSPTLRRAIDWSSLGAGLSCLFVLLFAWQLDPISSVLITFFGITMLRKAALDYRLKRA